VPFGVETGEPARVTGISNLPARNSVSKDENGRHQPVRNRIPGKSGSLGAWFSWAALHRVDGPAGDLRPVITVPAVDSDSSRSVDFAVPRGGSPFDRMRGNGRRAGHRMGTAVPGFSAFFPGRVDDGTR